MRNDKELIYNAVSYLNNTYKTNVDANLFFDSSLRPFYFSKVENNIINLEFPVVATRDFAQVTLETMPDNTHSVNYNEPFELEIKRLSSV